LISKNSFKKIKSLKQKKFREESQRLIVEGVRSIESIINDGALIKSVVYTQEFQSKNSDFIGRFNNELLNEITEKEMNQLSNSVTPPGVLVIAKYPQYGLFDSNKNAIFLDRISDPGNLGTMIRTASWFGIDQIILSKGCIDPFNPKVLAAAMGGHFQLKFLGEEKLDRFNDHVWIGASMDG
jgi:TrmH family RNA methyltransferase